MPVSSLTLRREGSQVGSHAHFAPTFTFQARIMPEGLTMVRMPWDEQLQEAPQPLSTWYKLPRPTCCSNSTCTPSVGLHGLHWEGGPLGPANPRGHMLFSIFALRITLREILSLLSCGFAFPAFISSSLFPDGQFPFCLLWDLETGELQGGVVLSLPALYLRGTGVAGVTRNLIIKIFIPGLSKVPTSGTELYTLAPEACNLRSV